PVHQQRRHPLDQQQFLDRVERRRLQPVRAGQRLVILRRIARAVVRSVLPPPRENLTRRGLVDAGQPEQRGLIGLIQIDPRRGVYHVQPQLPPAQRIHVLPLRAQRGPIFVQPVHARVILHEGRQ